MKLIIDIPETFYKSIKDGMWCGNNIMSNAIETGIPISNGTGYKDAKADFENKQTGKWEFHCQHWSKCSICGYADKFADKWNYCPNCGAKMENVEKSLIDRKAESKQ